MFTVDHLLRQLFSPAGAVVGGVFLLPVVFRFLVSSSRINGDDMRGRGTRKPVSPETTLPMLGNTWDNIRFMPVRHDWIAKLCERAKGEPILLRSMGLPDITVLSTVQAFEDVFKNQFENFPKGATRCEYLCDLLGDGIFAADGKKWIHQRKTASNLFTLRALRDSMTGTIQRHALVLERILARAVSNNETVDLFKLFNRFTLEAFAEIGFGVHMNCLDAEKEHPFQTAFDRCQRTLALRFIRPSWFWKVQRLLGVGTEGQFQRDLAVINSTIMDIVEKALQRHSSGSSQEGSDIVSLFLTSTAASAGGDKTLLNPAFLRDIVVNFLIAGRDTTAQALSWFFYNLSQNPEVENKIRRELEEELPELMAGTSKSPSMEQANKLVYLEAALRETLRLYPSVPKVAKTALHDTVLTDGTFVAANTTVSMPMYALGRMTHVWGPDATEFKPERWLDSTTGKLINVSAFKFIAFNAGPRTCLGKNLAMLEMKLIVSGLLSKFHIELTHPEDVAYEISLTLPIKGALDARITQAVPAHS